jgi:hypothetical protein
MTIEGNEYGILTVVIILVLLYGLVEHIRIGIKYDR